MKKLILTLSLGVLAAAGASAQISLNQSSFATASTSGPDTLLTTATGTAVFPTVTGATAFNLDFTTAVSAANRSILYRVAGTGANQWADSVQLKFSGFGYIAKIQSSVTASGYVQAGEHINRAAYSLQAASIPFATPADSIVINGQDIVFSANRTRIAFTPSPATYHSAWASTYKYDFSFNMTYAALSLSNAAGIVRAYITEKDSVIGYGKVKVKDLNGNGSAYMDVLQIQSKTITTDSFFINGALASPTLLAGFNATQGQTSTTYDQYYFRAGELTPLVHVTMDTTNSTPKGAETHAARLVTTFIPETKLASAMNVYPNPVTGHVIIVSGGNANSGTWNYELENVNGQLVTRGAFQITSSQEKANIILNNNIASGTYFLHIYNNAGEQTIRTMTIR